MAGRIEGGRRLRGEERGPRPLISIIIVVFQAREDLPALLDSVLRLKDQNVELIVVDGGSDDGTRELLCERDSQIDYWLSEADQGIYDAMNKGIAAARGTFLFHLNAGDRLLHVPVRELTAAARNHVDVAAFRVSIDERYEFKPSCGIGLRFNNTLHHQGTFFRRESFPVYDIRYKIFADFNTNQQMALRGAVVEVFDQVVALHSTDGISSARSAATISEFFSVIASNHGWTYVPIAWILCKWRGLRSRLERITRP
jgi:hypothetical protein